MSRNDLGHLRMVQGDAAEAEAELARAERGREARAAQPVRARGHPLHPRGGAAERRPSDEALVDADRAIALLIAPGRAEPVPARHGRARQGPGADGARRVDDVIAAGEDALERLGDRVPQARA